MTELFSDFVDIDSVRSVLQRSVIGDPLDAEIVNCSIHYLRHRDYANARKPHKARMSACYELDIRYRNGDVETELVLVNACRDGSSAGEFATANVGELTQPRVGSAVTHLPELDATAWMFPNDPSIPGLAIAMNSDSVIDHLPHATCASLGGPGSVRSVSIAPVQYCPGRHCMARFDVVTDAGHTSLYGKTFGPLQSDPRALSLQAFQEARTDRDFLAPALLGFDHAASTLWLEAVDHIPLPVALAGDDGNRVAFEAGECLALLHDSSLEVDRSLTPGAEFGWLERKLDRLAAALPGAADTIDQLIGQLGRDVERSRPLCVTHGDFHMYQIGVDRDRRLVLFDFDDFRVADPARDLAGFIASLFDDTITVEAAPALARSFMAGYGDATSRIVPETALLWQLRIQLATKAYRKYRSHRNNLDRKVMALLKTAVDEDLVARMGVTGEPGREL